MQTNTTDDLRKELLSTEDIERFLNTNKSRLATLTLAEYLNALLAQKELQKADVINDAQLDIVYGYQLFQGTRAAPSRDKLLQLAFGFHLNINETQRLLRVAQQGTLYIKNRRDSIIMYALENGHGINQVNALLDNEEEQLLVR